VELPRGLQIWYPATPVPWEFGCDSFEVRKDGKLLDPIPVRMPGGAAPGSSCPGGEPVAQKNRLPLHLQYNFDEPGTYEVRLSHYGDFMRRSGDIRIQSAWTPIEVLPAAERMLVPSPEAPQAIVATFLPNLLAQRSDETLWILLGDLYNPSSFVRGYAANALYYWPDSVVVPQLLQSLRSYGPVPEAIGRLGSHAPDMIDSALPFLLAGNPVLTQGALAVARSALADNSKVTPDIRARVEQTMIAVASNAARMDPASASELISILGRIRNTQVHDSLWALADNHIAAPAALDAIAVQKDATDLSRLAAYLIATPADNQTDRMLSGVPNSLRSQFGAQASPWLRQVLAKSPSQFLRLACAKELMLANDPTGFAFALDAVEKNRPWKAQILPWVNDQFPESRNKTDAQVVAFLSEKTGATPR
jgi:hypothetical protein